MTSAAAVTATRRGSTQDLTAFLHEGHRAAWSLVALALGAHRGEATGLTRAAHELLVALGLTDAPRGPLRGLDTAQAEQVASQAAASLLTAAAAAAHRSQPRPTGTEHPVVQPVDRGCACGRRM